MLFVRGNHSVSVIVLLLRSLWIVGAVIRLLHDNRIYTPAYRPCNGIAESIVHSAVCPAPYTAASLFKFLSGNLPYVFPFRAGTAVYIWIGSFGTVRCTGIRTHAVEEIYLVNSPAVIPGIILYIHIPGKKLHIEEIFQQGILRTCRRIVGNIQWKSGLPVTLIYIQKLSALEISFLLQLIINSSYL